LREVSVIVSTYTAERYDYVLQCLRSLKKQTLQPKEVILVLDPDQKLIEFYKQRMPNDVKFAISEGFGLSNARNAGVKKAEGEIIAFIDDDAIADEDWLRSLVKSYDDEQVLGVGGLIEPLWETLRPSWFPEELYWIVGCSYMGLPKKKAYVRNPIGCNMSFRKQAFEKIGYFKTDIGRLGKKLTACEEAEFSMRILKRCPNARIVYDSSAVVWHRVSGKRVSLRYMLRRSFYEGFSKALISHAMSNPYSSLSVESRYLKHLLKIAIPTRIKRMHKSGNFGELITLILSMGSVLTGYFITKHRRGPKLME